MLPSSHSNQHLSQREVREHVSFILSQALLFVGRLNALEDSVKVDDCDAGGKMPASHVALSDYELGVMFVNVWETVVRSLVRAGEQILGDKLRWKYPRSWEGRPLVDDARELVHDTIQMHHFAHVVLEIAELPKDATAAATLMHLKVQLMSQIQELIGQYVELGGVADEISLRPLDDDDRPPRTEGGLVEAPF